MSATSSRSWLFILSALFVLVLAQWQFSSWQQTHAENLDQLIDAARGVLSGTPHWRAYQNRILSPALVHVMGWFTYQPMTLFVQGAIYGLNAALFLMIWRKTGHSLLAVLAVAACGLLWMLEHHRWSYTWDFTEAACWLALSWMALNGASLKAVQILILVSAFNRESALFMSLYPLVCGAMLLKQDAAEGRRWIKGGVLSFLVVLLVTEGLRKLLFGYSSLSGVGVDASHAVFENHINLAINLRLLGTMVEQASPILFILVFYGVSMLWLIQLGLSRRAPRLLGLGVALLAYFASLLVFGLLNELRLYQPLNWCLAFLLLASHRVGSESTEFSQP